MRRLVLSWTGLCMVFALHVGVGLAVEEGSTIRQTYDLRRSGGSRQVVIDNVWGSIKVGGHTDDRVEVVAHKTIEADSKEYYRRALEEVSLEVDHHDGLIEFYVDGPFRHNEGRLNDGRRGSHRHYRVTYDFDVKVPRDASVTLKTVNDGDIEVQGVAGDFEVENVNGGIDMAGLEGAGGAYAVNGDVTLRFDHNPGSACRFGSLNGDVTVYFQRGLSAELHLKTFNGEIFTDFPIEYLPAIQMCETEHNGRTVYKASETHPVRVGEGGAVIELDGFNGDMFILQDH